MPYVPPHLRNQQGGANPSSEARSLASLSTSKPEAPPRARATCKYGERCHNQQPGHLLAWAHHGDADYVLPAVSPAASTPTCLPRPAGEPPDAYAHVPLVTLPADVAAEDGRALRMALERSGFALVAAPGALSRADAAAALRAVAEVHASHILAEPCLGQVSGIHLKEDHGAKSQLVESLMLAPAMAARHEALAKAWAQLQEVKRRVLLGVEFGLQLPAGSLADVHEECNDTLRTLRYPHVEATRVGRMHEHVDYGSVTLLLQDVAGLEVLDEPSGWWLPVPLIEGAPDSPCPIVLNIGKELAEMSGGRLKAAMHRVPGPAAHNSAAGQLALAAAGQLQRHAMAVFVEKERFSSSAGKGRKCPKDNTPGSYQRPVRLPSEEAPAGLVA